MTKQTELEKALFKIRNAIKCLFRKHNWGPYVWDSDSRIVRDWDCYTERYKFESVEVSVSTCSWCGKKRGY